MLPPLLWSVVCGLSCSFLTSNNTSLFFKNNLSQQQQQQQQPRYKFNQVRAKLEKLIQSNQLTEDDIIHHRLEDSLHHEKFAAAWNCHDFQEYTANGDPIHLAYVGDVSKWEAMTIQEMREFFAEHYIRNEMKIDLLSRRQHRCVYVVPVVMLAGLSWDLLIHTPIKIEFVRLRREVYSCAPGLSKQNHVVVVEQSWLAQQFVDKFAGLVLPKNQTFCVHGKCSIGVLCIVVVVEVF